MVTRKHAKWFALAVLSCVLVLAASFGAPAEQKVKGAQVLPEVRTAWQEPREEFVPGEYLVRFQDGVLKEDALGVLRHAGMEVLKEIYFKPSKAFSDGLRIYHVKAAAGVRAEDAARVLKADSRVRYAAPNRKLHADGPTVRVIPSDTYFSYMWGLNNTGQEFYPGMSGTPDADIDAPEAWDIRHDAPTIVVADIDTGIQWNHPDLQGNIWVNPGEIPGNGVDDDDNGYVDDIYGWDFVNEDNSVYDGIDDHGTHTAGTVAAVGNNALGVTGVAWNVKIMCLKFLEYGSGYTDDAVEAFAYAWNNGANLTTNSWGYTGPPDEVLQDAMEACALLHACAAGNSARDNDAGYPNNTHYPSSFPLENIISVAASDWNDNFAYFSCWGATTVDLAAPGHYILSSVPTDQYDPPYAYFSGTSMATPHVAGAAALLMAHFPGVPPFPDSSGAGQETLTIKDLLLATVDRKPAFQGKLVSHGRLNLHRALLQDMPGPPDISVHPTSLYVQLRQGEVETRTFTITNNGDDYLTYDITVNFGADGTALAAQQADIPYMDLAKGEADPRVGPPVTEGHGGPDAFGYVWKDSDDAGGPTFSWVDITGAGTPVTLGDDTGVIVPLPFTFPFYGQDKTSIGICSNGYLTFGSTLGDWSNDPIPTAAQPNDLVALFWDDLNPSGAPKVYYYHDTANNRFIVEYYQVPRFGGSGSLTMEAILYPDGRIVYQYLTMTGTLNSATIGIEDSAGAVGLQVCFNANYVHNNLAIEFVPAWLSVTPSTGSVAPGESVGVTATFRGGSLPLGMYTADIVVASNDPDEPEVIVDATMDVTTNQAPVIDEISADPMSGEPPLLVQFTGAAHDPDGTIEDKWWDFGDGSPVVHEWNPSHTYTAEGEYDAVLTVVDDGGRETSASVHVSVFYVPDIAVNPTEFTAKAAPGTTVDHILTIGNTGRADLHFQLRTTAAATGLPVRVSVKPADPSAFNTRGLLKARKPDVRPADQGDVIKSWPASAPNLAWGTGYDGSDVWVSHINTATMATTDYEYTTDGALTGVSFPTPWAGVWAADMAWDGHYLWQVNVGGDNKIYQIDPTDGSVVNSIAGPWSISQRGVAYDPDTDTFYVGGWNDDKVWHIKGLSWDVPGQLIGQFSFTAGIAGLAYHPDGVLWCTTNSDPDMVYALDPEDGTVIASFAHPSGGSYLGAGLEIDEDGNLWMTDQNNMVYLVDSGMPTGLPWLRPNPRAGTVAPGDAMDVVLTFDATELASGDYHGDLVVSSDDPDEPEIIIPLTFIVNAPPVAGFTVNEVEPNTIHFTDASTDVDGTIVAWTWAFGDGGTSTEQNPVHQYPGNGDYAVTLTVTDDDGDTGTVTLTVHVVNTAPVAAFTYTEEEPNKIHFLDGSTDVDGSVVAWAWDFGDGTTSTEQNPVHQYPTNEHRHVTLTVTDNDGASHTIEAQLNLSNAIPVATFTTGDEIEPNTIPFTSTAKDCDGSVVAYLWNFGDGSPTSTDPNPVHRFPANGEYTVTLTVTDNENAVGTGTATVLVKNTPPIAAFSYVESDSAEEPNKVTFTDESTDIDGTVAAWSWDFGDGSPVSTERDPVHLYAENGIYSVTLEVTDNDGGTHSITQEVEVKNTPPVVSVTSPAGGELWVGEHEVKWAATDVDNDEEDLTVKLEYSGDGGSTWKLIADNEPNDGSYAWDTSKVGRGGKYLVKVTATDPDGGVGEGRSGEFTIVVLSRTVVAAPNPASDCVTFYYSIGSNGTLYIYDIAGRLVHSAELSSEVNAYEWDLTSGGRPLANGLYLYLVVTEDGEKSEVGRLVISH